MGWSIDATLDASIPLIVLAYEGKMAFLKDIFGGGEKGNRRTVDFTDGAGIANLMDSLAKDHGGKGH